MADTRAVLAGLMHDEEAHLGVPAREGAGGQLREGQAEQLLVDGERRGDDVVQREVLAHRLGVDAVLQLEDALRVEGSVPRLDAAGGAAVATASDLTTPVQVRHLGGTQRRHVLVGAGLREIAHLTHEGHYRLGRARHARLDGLVCPAAVAEQRRRLLAQPYARGHQLEVVAVRGLARLVRGRGWG